MAKKISEELYQAFIQWITVEKRATDLHFAYTELAKGHIGPTDDRIDGGKLIVELSRMKIEREEPIGVSPSGKAAVSDTVIESSNLSTPEEEKEVDEEPKKSSSKGKRVAVASKKKQTRKTTTKRIQQRK